MKKRPNLILREPVKLYEVKNENEIKSVEKEEFTSDEAKINNPPEEFKVVKSLETILKEAVSTPETKYISPIKEKMSPRIQQIWDYFCQKAASEGEILKSISLTRGEVMKEAGIGSTNTYRDALKKFQDLGLIEIELRPGVNSGSLFTFTEKGISEIRES